MPDVDDRLTAIEDRFALQNLINAYFRLAESHDIAVVDLFIEDAIFDARGLNVPLMISHAELREHFAKSFADISHSVHYASNFTLENLSADEARFSAYVNCAARSTDGRDIAGVHVLYVFECLRRAGAWKIKRFIETAKMPLPASVTEVLGQTAIGDL